MEFDIKVIKEALGYCTCGCSTECYRLNNGEDYVDCKNALLRVSLAIINDFEKECESLKDKNFQLEQNLAQCENGYNLELHTARYQLFTLEEDLQRAQDKIDNLHMAMCNLRVQSRNEVVTRLRQLGERLKCKVLLFRCEGYAIHPFFFEIDKIVEEFIDSYEK